MRLDEVILPPDTRANQPAANTVPKGTLYSVTDEDNKVEWSDGSAWVLYTVGGGSGGSAAWGNLTGDINDQGDLQTEFDTKAPLEVVQANTEGVGAPYAITIDDVGKCFTNEGAGALQYNNLPPAAAGLWYTFVVQNAFGMRAKADTGDTIRVADNVSASAGFIKSLMVGASIKLFSINATEWIVKEITGDWEVT